MNRKYVYNKHTIETEEIIGEHGTRHLLVFITNPTDGSAFQIPSELCLNAPELSDMQAFSQWAYQEYLKLNE